MKKRLLPLICAVLVAGATVTALLQKPVSATVPGTNTLVSVNNTGDGQGGNGNSTKDGYVGSIGENSPISANGRYVVFSSNASNLVPGDTNARTDIFVRDLVNATTSRVDISTSGVQANDGQISSSGFQPDAISGTGRYVAFASVATNLIDGQTTTPDQVYLRDTLTNTTSLVSKTSSGVPSATPVGHGAAESVYAVSDDGRFVVWEGSDTTNLTTTETNRTSYYVFLTDRLTQTTTVLNHTPPTTQYFLYGITASCDGSEVAFSTRVQLTSADTDSYSDIYLVDLRNGSVTTGITTSSNSSKDSLYPSLSCNGDYVTFSSYDTSLITAGPVPTDSYLHTYLYNRITGVISLVDASTSGVIASSNSGYLSDVDNEGNVAFHSNATNLIDTHTIGSGQEYLKHFDSGEVELLSRAYGASAWTGDSHGDGDSLALSGNGKIATYTASSTTSGTTLIGSDTNNYTDVIASLTGL